MKHVLKVFRCNSYFTLIGVGVLCFIQFSVVCMCKLKRLYNYYLSCRRARAYSSAIVCCNYVVSVQRGVSYSYWWLG